MSILSTGAAAERWRLLIVDDDAVDRMTVRRLIDHSGLRGADITEAPGREEAMAELSAARESRVDCVILDYQLAGATGLDVLEDMRSRNAQAAVVVLTGRSDPETAAALVKAGALEFMTKEGLTAARLEQAIRSAVRLWRAELDARASEERLSATLRSIADAVVTVDRSGRVTYMNNAAEHLTGWSNDDAVGRAVSEVLPTTEIGARPGQPVDLLAERIAAVMDGVRDQQRVDMCLVARHGEQLDVDVTAAPLRDGSRNQIGAVIAIRDITDRRRAEADLSAANKQLQEQAVETEIANEQLLELNQQAEEAQEEADRARREVEELNRVGNTLAGELTVERIVDSVTEAGTRLTGAQFGAFFYNVVDATGEKLTLYALSGASREAFEKFGHPRPTPVFAPTFYGTANVRSDDITLDERYGKMSPYHGMPPGHLPVRSYLAVPVRTRAGDVIGGLFFGHSTPAVFTERSERLAVGTAAWAGIAMENARLYDAERRARSAAESANRAKAEFLANMSHELRTPLNAIGGYADLLAAGVRGVMTPEQLIDLDRIKRSQHHLLSLINDILNFARIEAGRVQVRPRDTPIDALLSELEPLIAPQLLKKHLRYSCERGDPNDTAYVDPERLQQILLNLLSNAVKFTEEGGEIRVRYATTADAVVIRVSDTGVGIPKDKLESIFEPFVQLDRARWSGVVGTGLGLAISRDLAREMGGDLTAESEIDVGSTFVLRVPARGPS